MIARGDLAIACGWDPLAEIEEENLHICAAALLPCIWATQVLESMVRGGIPTRAEITDEAMGAQAEHGRHRDQWRSCLAFSLEPSP